jgi:nitroreductase
MAGPSPKDAVRPLLRVRQVRDFTDEPLSLEVLDAVADVARWSGSAANTQPWRFVVIRSRHALRAIAEAGSPSTYAIESATGAIAIVLPDEPKTAVSKAFDEGRAAERILAAASACGVGAGIAWVRPDALRTVAQQLDLPDGHAVRTIVALGHPTEAARRPKSNRGDARLPREETVFYERWGVTEPADDG